MKKEYIHYTDPMVAAIYYRHIDTVFYNMLFSGGGGIIYLRR